MGQNEVGWGRDGMGWDGVGRDGMGWEWNRKKTEWNRIE